MLSRPRQPADRLLDRERDLLLDFLRPERRRDGVDLHLHRRRVGKGVDVEIAQRQRRPTAASASDARITSSRCRSEKSMIQFSMQRSLRRSQSRLGRLLASCAFAAAAAGAEVALQQLRFEHHAVLAGDHFARQQAGDDLRRRRRLSRPAARCGRERIFGASGLKKFLSRTKTTLQSPSQ